MVEGAIAAVFVFFLIFMIFQSVFYARAYLAARDAAASGARMGAVSADNPDADYDIMQSVGRSLSATTRNNIKSIVVFNPQGSNFEMPSGCKSAGIPGICNRYVAADLSRPAEAFTPGGGFPASQNWPSGSRSTSLADGLSHVGIYIELEVGGIRGPLPKVVSKSSITELEPHS